MSKTILYIEDDPASRSLVERTLRYGGYRVLIADCGLRALTAPAAKSPT
jgi:CheY-like chemotaxis protein